MEANRHCVRRWSIVTERGVVEGDSPSVETDFFRALVERGVQAVVLISGDGVTRYVNPAAASLLGYELERCLDRNIIEFIHPEDAARILDRFQRVTQLPGEASTGIYRCKRSDGAWVWIEGTAVNLLDDRDVDAVLITFHDVTVRVSAQAALAASEERYRAFVHHSSEGIYRLELDVPIDTALAPLDQVDRLYTYGYVAECNDVMARMYGFENSEALVGKRLPELLVRDDPANTEYLAGFVESHYRFLDAESHEVDREGHAKYFLNNSIGIVQDGKLLRVWGSQRDITELKRVEQTARDSEARLRQVIDLVPHMIFAKDRDGRFLFVNRTVADAYATTVEDMVGRKHEDVHPYTAEVAVMRDEDLEVIESGEPKVISESRFTDANGSVRLLQTTKIPFTAPGHAERAALGVAIDITERKRAEEALRASEERYALAARGASDGLWDWNLADNRVYFSPRWKAMLGHTEEDIGERPEDWLDRVHPEDRQALRDAIERHVEGVTPHFENEYRIAHRDGTFRWMLSRGLAVRDASGKPYRMAGSQTDITDRRRAEAQLVHRAFYDALTDLPNRTLFMERLTGTVERARRRKTYRFAVLFIDVDRFKVINDSLGHLPGDKLLIAIGKRLLRCLSPDDMLARLGGDEFAVLLDLIEDVNDARRVAERIGAALAEPFSIDGHEVFITVSIGIALSEHHHARADELLREADVAMYRAKVAGKARYVIYDAKLHDYVMRMLRLETDLRRAVDRREFVVHYQPIVAIATRRVVGFEALIRWRHPSQGVVRPDDFIPMAEETNLILPIDRWVLSEACRQLRAWQTRFPSDPPLEVSVNFSSRQFSQTDVVEQILATLQETGLSPSSLKLEITENALMENTETATRVLGQLKDHGVRLLIDDFGTGYSSLSYLHHFPIDTIKIDRSFVSQMDAGGEKNIEIVRAVLALAQGVGLDVVAEGVETEAQVKQLEDLHCSYAQGFYFSKPVAADAAEQLLVRKPG